MFKGKVYSYSNIDGKEKNFEKEFDNMPEYNDFISSSPEFSGLNKMHGNFSFDSLFDFNNYLDNFFHSRQKLGSGKKLENSGTNNKLEGVNLSKYEKEVIKMDGEKKALEDRKKMLEDNLKKLKGYLERFKKEKKDDLAKQVKEDIKKIEKKLAEL